MTIFSSDNVTPACPEIIEAINQANYGDVDSYGFDKWSKNLNNKFSELFEKEVKIFTAVTGTADATFNTNDDRGYVRLVASGKTITVTTCFDDTTDGTDTACTVAADRISNAVKVAE